MNHIRIHCSIDVLYRCSEEDAPVAPPLWSLWSFDVTAAARRGSFGGWNAC